MAVREKLLAVQSELKAPKNQFNSFGKYKYRSCEDILEGLKPVLNKNKATLVITDTIEQIGDRYYVKATAKFMDTEDGESIENTAFARESDDKKGMDASQVTGATSSYARKYALNGLFLIDDTKDADTDEFQGRTKGKSADEIQKDVKEEKAFNDSVAKSQATKITPKEQTILKNLCAKKGLDIAATFPKGVENLTGEQYTQAINQIGTLKDRA